MTPDVLTTIVLAAQGVIIAFIGYLAKRLTVVKKDVATVRHEVKNDHSKNLRVEQDERHESNAKKLNWLVQAMEGVLDRVDFLTNGYHANRSRIWDLEHTQPPRTQATTRRAYRDELNEGEADAQQLSPIAARDIPGRAPVWRE